MQHRLLLHSGACVRWAGNQRRGWPHVTIWHLRTPVAPHYICKCKNTTISPRCRCSCRCHSLPNLALCELTQPRHSVRARMLITLIGRPQHLLSRPWLQLSCSYRRLQIFPLPSLVSLCRSIKQRLHLMLTLLHLLVLNLSPLTLCIGFTGSALIVT